MIERAGQIPAIIGARPKHEYEMIRHQVVRSVLGTHPAMLAKEADTLLPELRQAEEAKHHRRYFRDGLSYGLAIYSGAIRGLAMGQIPGEIETEAVRRVTPRRASEIMRIEVKADADTARPDFEVWAGRRQFDLRRENGSYTNLVTAYAWMGWITATLNARTETSDDAEG